MHYIYSTQLRMKQKNMNSSELVTFLALLVLILFRRGKKGQEKIHLHYCFCTSSLLRSIITFLLQMLTSCQISNICYCYHFENSESQHTAGLCIYFGHKWNLQNQWDLSSQMLQPREVYALMPFAPA